MLFFAKFYESRFFTQAKFGAKFIPHKPSRFCYFIKIRGLASSENSIADKFTKMLEKGG